MRVGIFTREYPPQVYGGAGVHVDYLSRELAKEIEVEVHCWGPQQADQGMLHVRGAQPWAEISSGTEGKFKGALEALSLNLTQVKALDRIDLVHTHTWYASMAGYLAKKLYGLPFVLTTHSLEPLRAWKTEQLGSGYAMSSWMERTAILDADAIIAVSQGTRADILRAYPEADPERIHVIYNGIDLEEYQKTQETDGPCRLRSGPGSTVSSVCWAHHEAEGRNPPGGCDRPSAAGDAGCALRRSAGYAGDRRGDAQESGRDAAKPPTSCVD